jgi:hypothetical protein
MKHTLPVKKKIELIESVIDYSRDFNLIILVGVLKGYLPLKIGDVIAERPQQMYVRIALSVTDTDEDLSRSI